MHFELHVKYFGELGDKEASIITSDYAEIIEFLKKYGTQTNKSDDCEMEREYLKIYPEEKKKREILKESSIYLENNIGKEKPEIVNNCNDCGWFAENIYKCNSKEDCNKYSEWKPIEPEKKEIPVILKECGKCGWWDNDVYRCNSENVLDCGSNKSEWKPIKPEIVKNCENCGFSYDDTLCNNEKSCISISEWKPIEKKEKKVKWIFDTKYCSNCAKKIGTGKYDCKCKED